MIKKEITIKNSLGLTERPAMYFVQKATTFRSSIWIEIDDRKMSAKSVLGVLSLKILPEMSFTIIADGSDEVDAINGLVELINSDLPTQA